MSTTIARKTMLGLPLPNAWHEIHAPFPFQRAYRGKGGLQVIESQALYPTPPDNEIQEWYHVSISHPSRLPTYDEMKMLKALFIGDAYTALQILPPKDRHVNIQETCLHLWVALGWDVTPDFGKEGTI
jgi:hypothetical protein